MSDNGTSTAPRNRSSFPTTSWSVIGKLDSEEFSSAIEAVCEEYWYPIYAFIRRRCGDQHRAEDLTQGFFAHVLSRQVFRAADPDKGRFRSFVLTSVKNFLANQHAAENSQRRGGRQRVLSINAVAAEQLYLHNHSDDSSPEKEFERAWANTLLERAIECLKIEYEAQGKSQQFSLFVPSLQSDSLDYNAISVTLGIDVVAARKAASRFRKRYGQLLREEIAGTLSQTGDIEEEISWIISRFSR